MLPPGRTRIARRRRLGARAVLCVLALATGTSVAACDSDTRPAAHASKQPSPVAHIPPPSSPASRPLTPLQAAIAQLPKFASAPPPTPVKLPGGGSAPIYFRMPVKAPVAFLTMDDGLDRLPEGIELMKAAQIPFTMFLIGPVGASHAGYFKSMEAAGGVVEDHTITHTSLKGKPYVFQKNEICGARDKLAKAFGKAPTLFRPPYGTYDATTLRAAHDCGIKAAFYWSETVNNGKVYYQTLTHRIRAGDIILMHFRPAFLKDVVAALKAIHRAGLTPALLENYITPPPTL